MLGSEDKQGILTISVIVVLLIASIALLFFYAIPRLHQQTKQVAIKASASVSAQQQPSQADVQPQSSESQQDEPAQPALAFYTELSKAPSYTAVGKNPITSPAGKTQNTPQAQAGYVLQLAAFSQQSDAHIFSDRLALLGYQAYVVEPSKRHHALFLVCIGPYPDKSSALPDQAKLKKLHIASYVRKISPSTQPTT